MLHLATLSGVLACLMRHFRASLASLPLLSQPLGSLPLGTWSPDAAVAHSDFLPDSKERRQWRKLQVGVRSMGECTALHVDDRHGLSAPHCRSAVIGPAYDDARMVMGINGTGLCSNGAEAGRKLRADVGMSGYVRGPG